MKKTLLVLALFNASISFAQKDAGLKKNQEITITTSTRQTIDMGMQMTNNTSITSKVAVLDVNAKDYTIVNTNTKVVMDGNMMGQAINYDSDKKEDRESQIGQQFDGILNTKDTVLLDIKTGKGRSVSPEKLTSEKGNSLQTMMVGAAESSGIATASSILFIIAGDKKAGTQWTDSSTIEGMKNTTTYKIESISGNIATISSDGTIEGSSSMDMQGQSFDMTIKTKMIGTLLLDITTNLVKKRNNTAEVEGSIDMMGQSMPFTSKTVIESVYQ